MSFVTKAGESGGRREGGSILNGESAKHGGIRGKVHFSVLHHGFTTGKGKEGKGRKVEVVQQQHSKAKQAGQKFGSQAI
ncbi:unnamed protein product [Calypogeia fissa]